MSAVIPITRSQVPIIISSVISMVDTTDVGSRIQCHLKDNSTMVLILVEKDSKITYFVYNSFTRKARSESSDVVDMEMRIEDLVENNLDRIQLVDSKDNTKLSYVVVFLTFGVPSKTDFSTLY